MELDRIAKASSVKLDAAAAEALVEALGADVGRIAVEREKLSLYGKPITADELSLLVPDARQSTIFALVNALGRRDRARSLDTLDALVREGEYLPLALTFLAGQFRMALVAKEANLRGAQQVQGHFTKAGVPMWGSRAEQVWNTATKFSKDQLERGLKLIFEAALLIFKPFKWPASNLIVPCCKVSISCGCKTKFNCLFVINLT